MSDPRAGRTARVSLSASFRHALEGIRYVLAAERNARIHSLIGALALILGLWLNLPAVQLAMIVAAIALVFAGEMLNTVVEVTVDMITLEEHPLAKKAKDVAAGAVLVAAITSVVIGLLVLGPPLLSKIETILSLGG